MLRSQHGHSTRKYKNSSWSIIPRRSSKNQNCLITSRNTYRLL